MYIIVYIYILQYIFNVPSLQKKTTSSTIHLQQPPQRAGLFIGASLSASTAIQTAEAPHQLAGLFKN